MNDDLKRTAELLAANRPTLDDATRESVRRTVQRRAGAPRRSPVLVTMLLSLGLMTSLGGTGLAVSGLSSDTKAVSAQYAAPSSGGTTLLPSNTQTTPSGGGVSGQERSGSGVEGDSEVAGEFGERGGSPSSADQPGSEALESREVAASAGDGELPFTGLAAIPILVLGLVALGAGLILRRRTGPTVS